MLHAFDDLARLYIYADSARVGEITATGESFSLEAQYLALERTILTGLCIVDSLLQNGHADVDSRVSSLTVPRMGSNAQRHGRDYIFLNGAKQIGNRLKESIESLAASSS